MHYFSIGTFDRSGVLSNTQKAHAQISESIGRIASGVKSFTDNPVDAKISARISAQIDGLRQGMKNMQDEMGALERERSKTLVKVDVMHRIHELAIAYQNDTLTESARGDIQTQVDELSKILEDDKSISRYAGKVSVGSDGTVRGLGTNMSFVDDVDGSKALVVEEKDKLAGDDLNVNALIASNSAFIGDKSVNSVSSSSSLAELTFNADPFKSDDVDRMFDLSQPGALAAIEKSLDRYISSAANQTARLNAMEYGLDAMHESLINLENWHNNISSIDIAEEMVTMTKAQIQANMGQNLIKMQNDLEKNMVLNLLTF